MSDVQHVKQSEIATVRVRCLGCNGVVEVPVDRLEAVFLECSCPLCRQAYYQNKEEAELLPLVRQGDQQTEDRQGRDGDRACAAGEAPGGRTAEMSPPPPCVRKAASPDLAARLSGSSERGWLN